MAKRVVLIVVAVVGIVGGWITLRAQPAQDGPLCYLKNEKYSPGAIIRDENQIYRCFYVFGDNLNSRTPGVAWIKGTLDQASQFVPKEPSSGR